MKIAIIYNKEISKVINVFGIQNKEIYNPNTIKQVTMSLEEGGHNVAMIDGDMHVIEQLQDFMPKDLKSEKMGMVFNMAYGIQGESRYTHIPSMLEMLGIPYVGSSPSGHAMALDKMITKIILQKYDIPTPAYWIFSDRNEDFTQVDFPVIVKPKMESVSFGLRVAYDVAELKEAVQHIVTEFKQPALVEQFIRGREFAVGLLGNNPIEVFPILEIDFGGDPDAIQTLENKQSTPRNKICPAQITEKDVTEMTRLSISAFRALQLRDFARVDFRMDENGKVYILEINSMASLGPTSSYTKAAAVAGYNYTVLVNKMLDVAALRYFTSTEVPVDDLQLFKKAPLHVRVRGFLRGRQLNLEDFLKQLVNINTYVRNVEGVNSLNNLVKKQLSLLGFSHQSYPQVEVGNIHFYSNSDDEDIEILLLANVDSDTKLANQEYFRESEQKLFGTGIWENKGGLTVLLGALQSLRFTKNLKKLKLGILLTTDEALQGRATKDIIQRLSHRAKYIIGMHGAFLNGGLVTSRSGAAVYHYEINLQKTEDAAKVAVATSQFTNLIKSWVELSDPENGLVIAPNSIKFNSNITEPFAHGSVNLSVRFNDIEQMKIIDTKIRSRLPKKIKSNINYQFDGGIRRPPMIRTDKVDALWTKIEKVGQSLDINLREEHRWSSADICLIDENNFMIDGLGPVGIKPPNGSEFILRHSILERAALLAMSLYYLIEKHNDINGS
jgi:D-alanine-D-alanine ligase